MRRKHRWILALLCSTGCAPPFPDVSPTDGDGGVPLTFTPAVEDGALPPALRIGVPGRRPRADLRLYRGTLSDYHLRSIMRRAPPRTLEDRSVPVAVWLEPDPEQTVIAPVRLLLAQELYSVAELGTGLLGAFVVREGTEHELLGVRWPPAMSHAAVSPLVLCGGLPSTGLEEATQLAPLGTPATVRRGLVDGVLESECARLEWAEIPGGTVFLPPPALGSVPVEPRQLTAVEPVELERMRCTAPIIEFGPGCATVLDDRAMVRSGARATLWVIETAGGTLVREVPASGAFVVPGLKPAQAQSVEVTVYYQGSAGVRKWTVDVQTLPQQPHVTLTEVMADPLGAEPAQEWVEIVNDGSIAVELAGILLEDEAGATVLPSFRFEPGRTALIVPESFEPSSAEVHISAETELIRVPRLGGNGLSNSGERLRLLAPTGVILSTFPRNPKPKAGVSVARRATCLLDDAGAFAYHASPGSSPGRPNNLDADLPSHWCWGGSAP